MSVLLNGVDEYLAAAFSPVSSYPLTFSGWFKSNANDANQGVISYDANASSPQNIFASIRGADVGDDARAGHRWSTNAFANSTTNYVVGTWQMITAVFASQSNCTIYLDGGNSETDTGNAGTPNFATLTHFRVGARAVSSVVNFFDGLLAEIAVWDVDLSPAEISNLRLLKPNLIRPGDITFYASYETDFSSFIGSDLSPVGSPTISGDHPQLGSPAAGGGRDGGWLLRRRNPSGGLAGQ